MLPDVSVVLRDLLAQLLLACSLREHSLISHASLRKQKRTREQEQENKNNSPEDKGDPDAQSPGAQAPSQVCKHLCLLANSCELRNGLCLGATGAEQDHGSDGQAYIQRQEHGLQVSSA